MKALKMCLNWKVIAVLAAVGAGLFAFAPSVAAAALPLLILAICPLSMLLMMGAMNGMKKDASAETPLGPSEQLAQLRMQQQDLADKITALEVESHSSAKTGGQLGAPT